jgi:uncharacterized membrane protein YgcG
VAALGLAASGPGDAVAAGPPFPPPEAGRYVYDTAGVFSGGLVDSVQRQIEAIRTRTGAEIVVYSQVVEYGVTREQADADARALMDQWGVGRRGFDDGLVILYDLDPSRLHGQVQLYAGPGYRATLLSNEDRQAIFENEMLPLLKAGNLGPALEVAMARIDANATPEHAANLERGRQLNAVLGLVGAPMAFILLVGWAAWSWLRFGRDPVYLDDPSILMPAPPPGLTAASGALVFDGHSSRHTLTTAMLDLASRGELAFRPEESFLGRDKVSIDITTPDENDPRLGLNRRAPVGPAETFALGHLTSLAEPGDEGVRQIDSKQLLAFGKQVSAFDDTLEADVVGRGWFREKPARAMNRWFARGSAELAVAVIAFIAAFNLPSDGLLLVACACLAAGLITLVVAPAMPARTMAGAVIRAMLAAYRRTLHRTLEQARSMTEVVDSDLLPWLRTPDQAVVWGVALGLRDDVERVLQRTAEDLLEGRADPASVYVPLWFGTQGGFGGGVTGSGSGFAPGLMASSAIPDFGGMFAAIGTIGNAPSSSGGGGGGFGGGGSGGGGGGSGGGF